MSKKTVLLLFFFVYMIGVYAQGTTIIDNDKEKNTTGHYIAGGTYITMGDETHKEIENIRARDIIMSYNPINQTYEPRVVTKVHKTIHARMVRIKLENDNQIVVTGNLPLLSTSGWRAVNSEMAMLNPNYQTIDECGLGDNILFYDIIYTNDSPVVMIQGLHQITTAYSITLENDGAYIANGFLIGQI